MLLFTPADAGVPGLAVPVDFFAKVPGSQLCLVNLLHKYLALVPALNLVPILAFCPAASAGPAAPAEKAFKKHIPGGAANALAEGRQTPALGSYDFAGQYRPIDEALPFMKMQLPGMDGRRLLQVFLNRLICHFPSGRGPGAFYTPFSEKVADVASCTAKGLCYFIYTGHFTLQGV